MATVTRTILIFLALLFSIVTIAAAATALTIVSPTPGQHESPVSINLTTNQTQDSLSYSIVPGNATGECTNCSAITESVSLAPGNYTLTATSVLGNRTEQADVSFEVVRPEAAPDFSISILDPNDNQTYPSNYILINLATNITADNIEYRLDNGSFQTACTNCSAFQTTLQVLNGTHTLAARASLDNVTKSDSATFTVAPPQEAQLSLTIASPHAQQYTSPVLFSLLTDKPAAISYRLNNATVTACSNCSDYEKSKSLSPGNYTLTVLASAQNQTVNGTVSFSVVGVNQTGNQTNGHNKTNESRGPRFTLRFEKLPQLVESGGLNDTELAAIIRANKLNPGILNRLVKTGKLGNESIAAIIDTQKTPPGIFRKILGLFGIYLPTPKEELVTHYNLSEEQMTKLLTDDDVSEQVSDHLKRELKRIPPGQAKRQSYVQDSRTQTNNRNDDQNRSGNDGRNNEESGLPYP